MVVQKKIWLIPVVLAVGYALAITASLSGWTYSLYDDMEWLDAYEHFSSLFEFLGFDLSHNGRFRPGILAYSFARFKILGTDPQIIRISQVCVFGLTLILFGIYLRKLKTSFLAIALGVAFILKSPPALEQLKWIGLNELPAILLMAAGLSFQKKIGRWSYLFFLLAASMKESFFLFLPLPAILQKRYKDALVLTVISFSSMGYFYAARHGYAATYTVSGITSNVIFQVVKGLAVDFGLVLPVFVFLYWNRKKLIFAKDAIRAAFVLSAFGICYFVLVLPKAWGYCYMFAPSTFLLGCALALLIPSGLGREKLFLFLVGSMIFIFPLRLGWNWTRTYLKLSEQKQAMNVLLRNAGSSDIPISTNCNMDFIYLKGNSERRSIPFRCSGGVDNKNCCNNVQIFAVFSECEDFDTKVRNAEASTLKQLFNGQHAKVYRCR